MGSVNKVILVGNLGRDAELRYTPGGTAVANLRIATTETWTDRSSGQRQEHTEWHSVDLWDKQAETLQEYLRKGRQIYVEGSLRTRQWDDREGNKRYSTNVRASRVVLLGRGEGSGPRDDSEHPRSAPRARGAEESSDRSKQAPDESPELTEDDIPF
jgi:single-strand DNA-binding protein